MDLEVSMTRKSSYLWFDEDTSLLLWYISSNIVLDVINTLIKAPELDLEENSNVIINVPRENIV